MKRAKFMIIGGILLMCGLIAHSQTTRRVAFRTVKGEPSRYVTVDGNALDSVGKSITGAQVFELTDINGGDLEGGDEVKIKYGDKYWRLDNGNIVLYDGVADSNVRFTVVTSGKWIRFKCSDGTYVEVPGDGGVLTTTKEANNSYSVLELKKQ